MQTYTLLLMMSFSAASPTPLCPQDADDPLASMRQACVAQINTLRASIGMPPLQRWCGAGACIDKQAAQDANSQVPHHSIGQCLERGQNECPNYPQPADKNIDLCLQQMWKEGPGEDFAQHGHYLNMTNPAYTTVECGFMQTDGHFWAVQNFH